MDKAQALQTFWSSFQLTAIDEQSAYDTKIELPDNYITYEVVTSNVIDTAFLTASLWYKSTSWAAISQKADEVAEFIGYGGRVVPVTGGYLWIKLGSPFAMRMAVEQDNLRRIVMNISVDFLTAT